jgi:hypothetical protein
MDITRQMNEFQGLLAKQVVKHSIDTLNQYMTFLCAQDFEMTKFLKDCLDVYLFESSIAHRELYIYRNILETIEDYLHCLALAQFHDHEHMTVLYVQDKIKSLNP